MYHLFIHSSVDGRIGCFHVLAIVNSAIVNTGVHISFQTMVFFGYMPRSRVAGSYGSSIFNFLHTVFHSDCTSLRSNRQRWNVPLFSTLSPTFIVCRLFDDGRAEWCEVTSHCSFYLLSMCLLAIHMSSLEKSLFRFSAHFFDLVLYFLFWAAWTIFTF